MVDPKEFCADPSPLYGRIFNKDLRDRIFEFAAKLLGLKPEQRNAYVGTEYYVLRTIEAVGKKLIADGDKAAEAGAGHYSAYGPWIDFSDMVVKESYFPKAYVPARPAEAPKTTPRPERKPVEAVKPGTKLGDTISPETKAELKAAVSGIEPAPAPDFKPEPKKKGKGKKPAETVQTEEVPVTEAAQASVAEAMDESAPAPQVAVG